MMDLSHEVEIHACVDDEEVIITSLFDLHGELTYRGDRAISAIGLYLTGPRAGELFCLDEPRQLAEVREFRLH